jgi:flagellar hook-basal body complex protein FliE
VSIGPVSMAIAPIAATAATAPTAGTSAAGAAGAAGATAGTDFAQVLSGGLDHLNAVQGTSDDLALQAATGQLQNPHDYLIASTQAQLTTELTVAVRNKALEAFNEIMRMPV